METINVKNEAETENLTEDILTENAENNEFADFDDIAEAETEEKEREAQREKDAQLPPDPDAILEVRHLKKYFVLKKTLMGKPLSTLKAVDDVSFKVKQGETLGIVGESGCGKTTMGRTILKLYQPTSGQVFFKGTDIAGYKPKEMRPLRTKMQIVFQDPYSSLPPRSTVGDILSEPVLVHNIVPKEQVKEYVMDLMERCGLRDYYYERYPHEFSGGQRQRICIARALITKPDLIIADEPISALDVSIQAQVLNLLNDLRHELGLTILFIAHDLSVVKYFSERVAVMNRGRIVEMAPSELLYQNPVHPYTRSLLSAIPIPNPILEKKRVRFSYDPAMHVYDEQNQPQMIEVEPGHLVFLSQKEYQEYLEAKKHEG